jgi:hypothetical protein
MNFGWKFLLPVALTSIVVTGTLWIATNGNRLWIGIGNVVAAFIVVSIVARFLVVDNNNKSAAQGTPAAAPLRGLDAIE